MRSYGCSIFLKVSSKLNLQDSQISKGKTYLLVTSEHILNTTQDDMFHDKNGVVNVEELWTIWSGLCYRITPLYKTRGYSLHYMRIHFSQSISDEDLPKIIMIFTSEAGSDGIIDYEWVGKDFSIELDPNEEFEYDINLQPEAYESLQLTSGCAKNISYYNCVSKK